MLWLLIFVPAGAGLLLLATTTRLPRAVSGIIVQAALAATFFIALLAASASLSARLEWSSVLSLSLAIPPTSAVMAALVPFVAAPVLLYATSHEQENGLQRLLALMLLFVAGMELLVVADDLLTLLIGWELVGACSWALIGHDWHDRSNPAAGLYAFLTTRVGDLGLFVAAMAAFAGTGSFAFGDLHRLPAPYIQIVAFGLLLSAAAKSGQVPFSPWLFRAMSGPTSVSALLHAAAMVAAGAYILVRLHPVVSGAAGFASAAIVTGLVTALAGGVVALLQPHAKKLLAASTSAHYGLMFVAVGTGYPGLALLHLVAHALFKAPLFLAAGTAGRQAGSFILSRMSCGRTLTTVAVLSGISALALAGVPPMGAGWTKEAVTAAAEHHGLLSGAGIMVAGGLSAAYAARFQTAAYGLRSRPTAGTPAAAPGEVAGIALLAGVSLVLSLLWIPTVHERAAVFLDAHIPSSTATALVASLTLVAGGIGFGALLGSRVTSLGQNGVAATASDWFGLPHLTDVAVTRPFRWISTRAACCDDAVFDAIPRTFQRLAASVSASLARRDQSLVDRGVEAVARFAAWLSRTGNRSGELAAELLPKGTASLAERGGRNAVRLQSGMSHDYYAVVAGGALVAALLLVLGG